MPLIIPAGFGQVLHQLRLAGDPEPMAVTYGVAIDAGGVTNAAALGDELHEAFYAAVKDQLPTTWTLYQTELKWRDVGVADLMVQIHVEPKAMVAAGAALPQNVAGLIHKLSASAGRRNRGRFYLPGLREGEVSDTGLVNSGSVTGINNALATWLAKFGALIGQVDAMVILHSTGISGAPTPTPVTQLLIDAKVATQRRRLRK
jgi:hypothetical protein